MISLSQTAELKRLIRFAHWLMMGTAANSDKQKPQRKRVSCVTNGVWEHNANHTSTC